MNKITVWWIYNNRYFVKKLKKPQISSKSHEMTFLRPKQSMNSLLGVKIAQNPYFWFGYNSSKWRKITHWTCFSTNPKKVYENFSIQSKNDRQKTHFRSEKTWESIESNFYKLVHLIDNDPPVCTILLQNTACKKVAFNALSSFFASKMSFLAIIF